VAQTTNGAAVLDREAVDALRAGFRGEIIEAGDAAYDEARAVFNAMFDRRPRVILRPAGTADVVRGVQLARETGLPLAVRGGGHSVAGFSVCDDGIVLDLRAMKGIRVDPEHQTVRAQAGLTWGELDHETQAFSLAVTGGRVTTTGVVGFTLGAGSGWLERKLGFACDNVIRADVVTAAGEVVTASEDQNQDLLWGLKGGGGNFGVVTELEFKLSPVGPIGFGGLAAFPPDRAGEVAKVWRDISAEAPDNLGWGIAFVTAPPEPFVPEEWQLKRVCGVIGFYPGDLAEAERVLQPLRSLGPIVDLFQPLPYTVFQSLIDPANPFGRNNYWRAHNLDDLDDDVIDAWREAEETNPSPFTAIIIVNGGGAIDRVSDDATAIAGRKSPFNIHLNGMWEGDEANEANIAWVRSVSASLGSHVAPGISLNFQTEIGDAQLRESIGDAKVRRLREIKDRYDPTNLFRLNQNIQPSQ
jgi:hypothetical protein